MRFRRVRTVALTAAALLAGHTVPAHAAGTPRSQFWSNINRPGDKLDKDVTGTGDASPARDRAIRYFS